MRAGKPFKGQPAFEWTIHGEKGDILFTSPAGPYIFSGDSYDIQPRIEIHDLETDEVVNVEWDWLDWQKDLFIRGRNVGGVYDRYAAWWDGGRSAEKELPDAERFPRLLDAQVRMDHLEKILKDFDEAVESLKE
ncbi:hypothetical protein M406DRAFT_57319 [Cryphonectria parasitica EP155]|uniref:Uncharacterized protein n=1 Tax=Cryphonectria parasitica (strain ATCC 38755 / EP155) TaxID=660469 RepID=A0A9P5CLN6_CRYP1|nr:uncharacterized protein M406DRAFT_57319 [Cryphonectria parasitica EP155]KAF3763278.1 hypothetical protein M406DRAFT_57319 [Cryphonectria parasitica EP155]